MKLHQQSNKTSENKSGLNIRFVSEVFAVQVVSADAVGDIKPQVGQSYVSPDAGPVFTSFGTKSAGRRTDGRGAGITFRPLDRINSAPHDGNRHRGKDTNNEDYNHQLNERKTFLLFDFYVPKLNFRITIPHAN